MKNFFENLKTRPFTETEWKELIRNLTKEAEEEKKWISTAK